MNDDEDDDSVQTVKKSSEMLFVRGTYDLKDERLRSMADTEMRVRV